MYPPTVIVGLHGSLTRRPWFDRVVERDPDVDVAEDLLALAVDRAGSYGWRTVSTWLTEGGEVTARHEPSAWTHEEVGGDWTEDGRVRQLAWLQGGLVTAPPRPGLPVRPMALVLSEALNRLCEVTFTGLHALLPLEAAERDTAFHQTELAPWFALADPGARRDVLVSVSARPGAGPAAGDAAAVCAAVADMAQEAVTIEPSGPVGGGLPGLDLDAARAPHTAGMREVLRLRCRTREWSPDLAVWLVEMVAEALRTVGRAAPVMVSVSLAAPPS